MLSFKDYILQQKQRFLSWPSSFQEIKNPEKKEEGMLSWPSSHAERREKETLKEAKNPNVKNHSTHWSMESDDDQPLSIRPNKSGERHHALHEHPDVKGRVPLTKDAATAVRHYCHEKTTKTAGASHSVNGYLRNRAGDRGVHSRWEPKKQEEGLSQIEQTEKDHYHAIKKLSSAFTPDTTNRKEIDSYGGIPKHIGDALMNGNKGDKHVLAGFTSTSTRKRTAHSFAHAYDQKDGVGERHLIHYHVSSGAGLSIVHYSKWNENEVLLHHGAHVTYNNTDKYVGKDGVPTYVHHVKVHPTHTHVDDYKEHYGTTDAEKVALTKAHADGKIK